MATIREWEILELQFLSSKDTVMPLITNDCFSMCESKMKSPKRLAKITHLQIMYANDAESQIYIF